VWHSMFAVQIPMAETILRTALVYAMILILFRFTGKRGLATLNMFGFVVLFLLSNIVQNAIIGSGNSLLGGIIGAATLVAVNAALNRWLAICERAARVLEDKPTNITENGRYLPGAARRLSRRPVDAEHAIRVQNGEMSRRSRPA
jgi:uncharacterized membrane protein YcaP (DUF421 family)